MVKGARLAEYQWSPRVTWGEKDCKSYVTKMVSELRKESWLHGPTRPTLISQDSVPLSDPTNSPETMMKWNDGVTYWRGTSYHQDLINTEFQKEDRKPEEESWEWSILLYFSHIPYHENEFWPENILLLISPRRKDSYVPYTWSRINAQDMIWGIINVSMWNVILPAVSQSLYL